MDEADDDVRLYLKRNLAYANSTLKGLENREATIIRIVRYMVNIQAAYLTNSISAPVPLTIRQIANDLDLNSSTVSRAIKDKYILFRGQAIRLKELLGQTIGGTNCSKQMIQVQLSRFIAAEDKTAPLSDSALCSALAAMKISIPRRTIAAYREELGIPSALIRKTNGQR